MIWIEDDGENYKKVVSDGGYGEEGVSRSGSDV